VEVNAFVKRQEREKTDDTNFTNLYIKNLPSGHEEEASLRELFGKYGEITSCAIMSDAKGRKFAFVNFETNEAAKNCVEEMHKKDFRSDEDKAKDAEQEEMPKDAEGHPNHLLYVSRAQSKAERMAALKAMNDGEGGGGGDKAEGVNLYVKNLDENTDDAALRELFEPFGTMTSVAAMKDEQGRCKGFGFVRFASPDEATKAVTEMHLKVIKGKPLYVGLAEKREARLERLRNRYQMPGGAGGGKMGGKGGMPPYGMQQGMMGKGGMPPQGMYGMQQGMMGGGGMMPQQMQQMQMMGMQKGMPMGGMMPQQMQMMGMQKGMPMGGMVPGKGMPMMGMMPGKGMPGMMGGMPGKGMPAGMMGQMPGKGMNPAMMGMPAGMMGQMPGKGMNPAMQGQQRPPQQMPPQGAAAPGGAAQPLTGSALAAAPPGMQKQMLGEKLFPLVAKYQPELAGKVTGMMLEMDNSELLMLLESEQQLKVKVDEALLVLQSK